MLRDARDVAIGGEVVDEICVVSGGYISLAQIPKVSDVQDNLWLSAAAASANISVLSVYSGGAWIPLTISATLPVTTSQYYCDAVTHQYSNRIYVHANYNGCNVHVTYIGLGSLIEAVTINTILTQVADITDKHLYPYALSTYSDGRMDNSVPDGTQIYLSGTLTPIVANQVQYTRDGGFLEFSSGAYQVTSFTNAQYWKRLTLSLRAGVLTQYESDEYAFQEDLPDYLDVAGFTVCAIDVQNNGTTGVAGAITDITQYQIHVLHINQQNTIRVPYVFKNFGPLETGGLLDSVIAPGKAGFIESFVLSCTDTPGDSGSTILNIFRHVPGDATGTSIFSIAGNKPTIAASGGVYQVDITPSAHFNQSYLIFDATMSFRVVCEQKAVNAAFYSATLWLEFYA